MTLSSLQNSSSMELLADPSSGEVPAVHVLQTFMVGSRSTINIRLVLNVSDKVQGSFKILRVYGYGDNELKFRVLDETETSHPVILDLGTVVNDVSFDFTVAKSGGYLLVFDNEPSSSISNSQKEIQLSCEITSAAMKPK